MRTFAKKKWYRAILAIVFIVSLIFTLLGNLLHSAFFVNLAKTFFFITVGLVILALVCLLGKSLKRLWQVKILRFSIIGLITAFTLVIGPFFFFAAIQERETHHGDLILSGNKTMTISNKRYKVMGKVIIEDNATLKLTDRTYFEIHWTPDQPNELLIQDNAQLIIDNATLKGGAGNVRGKGKVIIKNVSSLAPLNMWFNLGDYASLVAERSDVTATIGDHARLEVTGGSAGIELTFPKGLKAKFSLPAGKISEWRFSTDGIIYSSEKLNYEIVLRDTKMPKGWGMTLSEEGEFAFIDSPALGIGFSLDEPADKPVVLTGLKERGYWENKTFKLGSRTTLRLIRSGIRGRWYFGTLGETHLIIKDSQLADPVQLDDNSVVTFENCVITYLGAMGNATLHVRNSKVEEWARAQDNARIYFENTSLPWSFPSRALKLYEVGNGQIFIDGKPFEKQ